MQGDIMSEFICSELLAGKPGSFISDREEKCYRFLDSLNIEYQRVEYNFFPIEQKDAEKLEEVIEATAVKNLLFHTFRKHPDYYLIVNNGKTKFDTHKFRDKYNVTKIELVSQEELLTLLDSERGQISIIELINDVNGIINVYLDKSLLQGKYFRFHPNNPNVLVRVKMEDFINKVLPSLNHKINIMELD